MIINESESYKYNSSSPYYNDKCYHYLMENGIDITIDDRRNIYINKNMSLCENNCDYGGYNNKTLKALCKCEVKDEINTTNLIKDFCIDKEKLKKNFLEIKTVTNLDVLKCYKLLFKKDIFTYNIGSYIILSTILVYILLLIIFILKGYLIFIKRIYGIIETKKINSNKDNIKKKIKEFSHVTPPLKNKNKKNKKKRKNIKKNKNNGDSILNSNKKLFNINNNDIFNINIKKNIIIINKDSQITNNINKEKIILI